MRYTLSMLAALGLALALGLVARAADEPFAVSAEALARPDPLRLDAGWRYRPGDDPAWADPGLDDSDWERVERTSMPRSALPASGWPGIGWFRLRLAVAPDVAGRPVALQFFQTGASEVYVDGRLAERFGVVSAESGEERTANPRLRPVAVVFDGPGEHVVALRYSCAATAGGDGLFARLLERAGYGLGFAARIDPANAAVEALDRGLRTDLVVTGLVIGFLLASALVHALLFAFYPAQRANLYYSVFTLAFAATMAGGYGLTPGPQTAAMLFAARTMNRVGIVVLFLAFVRFLYGAFGLSVPRRFWALAACWTAAGVYTVAPFGGVAGVYPTMACISLTVTESILVLVRAIRGKVDGAWIIGAGEQFFALGLTVSLVNELAGINSGALALASLAMLGGFPVCVSLYLAKRFARVNRDLEARLAEVGALSARALEHERREAAVAIEHAQDRARAVEAELRAAAAELQVKAAEAQAQAIEAEHRRKSLELEEARELQLAMLPKSPPAVPGLEIAAWMRTATEVGGDYYDFHVGEGGELTVAVGDATGHGLKAGTLVAAVKGLFGTLAASPDVRDIFRETSRVLRRMRLGRLYMAMTVARFSGREMTVSSAGMPAALVARAATGEVETVALSGMWLGAVSSYPYETRTLELAPGDMVLLMSDGFPEMFDERREMLGYERAAEIFRGTAGGPPSEVIDRLREAGERWAGSRPQDDDVTFVAIRVADE